MAWTLLDSGAAGFSDGATSGGHTFTFPGGAASAGDLLCLFVSSDDVTSTPSGWSVAISDATNLGAYSFYKFAAGGETSVLVTTGSNTPAAAAFHRYSGAANPPIDVSAKAVTTSSAATTGTATTATLAGTNELAVFSAHLGGRQAAVQSGFTPSAGYTNQVNAASAGTGSTDQVIATADKTNAGSAAESASMSWTNATNNQTALVATFKAAAVTSTLRPTPVVVSGPNRVPVVGPPLLSRSSFIDLPTRGPLVVTAAARPAPPAPAVILRNTLADPPVLTTPGPLVVPATVRPTGPNQAFLSRSSLLDVAVVSATTSGPLVVSTQPVRPAPVPPLVLRSTLADPPVLTTPASIVVGPVVRPAPVTQPLLLRSSLFDAAGTAAVVVSQPWHPQPPARAYLSRSTLADAVAAGTATPQPLVAAVRHAWPPVRPALVFHAAGTSMTPSPVPGSLHPSTAAAQLASVTNAARLALSTSGGHA